MQAGYDAAKWQVPRSQMFGESHDRMISLCQGLLMVQTTADTSRRAGSDRLILVTNLPEELKQKGSVKK